MRNFLLIVSVVAVALVSLGVKPALTAEPATQLVLNSSGVVETDQILRALNMKTPAPMSRVEFSAFCGQCTKDDDCGTGKCCPMSGCPKTAPNGCYMVAECP